MILPEATATAVAGFTSISVGFKQALNYEFVVKNSLSSAQIFEFLPDVLTYPFDGFDQDEVQVVKLVPFSSPNVDYIITVAELLFPKSKINDLQSLLLDKTSDLYSNPDSSQETLANLIDSRVPIQNLILNSDGTSSSSSNILSILQLAAGNDGDDSSSSQNVDSDDLDAIAQSMGSMDGSSLSATVSNKTSSSSLDKKSIAGIVVGCVVGVAIYAAGMFTFILWKRRRNARQRAMRNLIRLDSASSDVSSTDGSSFEYLEDDVEKGGDIKLDLVEEEKRGSFLQRLSLASRESGVERGKFIPEISAPMDAKNTLGW